MKTLETKHKASLLVRRREASARLSMSSSDTLHKIQKPGDRELDLMGVKEWASTKKPWYLRNAFARDLTFC